MARLKAATTAASSATRERLAAVIETTLSRIFDAPIDIRNTHEALHAIIPNETGAAAPGAVRKAAEWGAARAARRIGTRYGSKMAGRAVAPIGMALEFGMSARDGLRELQVLASFLLGRLRHEGYVIDHELVRRVVLALYLEPRRRPDLGVPLHRRSLAVAKRWTVNSLPLTGRRQTSQSRQRVEAIAGLDLAALFEDWRRVNALIGTPLPPSKVLEARIAPRLEPPAGSAPPSGQRVRPPVPPPPPPPPPRR